LPALLRNCYFEVGPLRRTDEAVRDLLKILRSRLHPPPQLARTLAGHIAERATESAQAVPARLERDFNDRQVRVAQQRGSALDTTRQQVAMWRYSEGVPE
jgi:hypothetical protein